MTHDDSILDGFITQAQLAAQLGKCKRTLKRWHALRYGPRPVRVGKNLYYHVEDVRTWLATMRQDSHGTAERVNRTRQPAFGGG